MLEPSESHEEAIKKLVAANLGLLKQRKARSTLTEQSASDFKPYFDMAIETGQDVLIKFITFFKYTPLTLRRKVNDALRYYCTSSSISNEDKLKYLNLRRQIMIVMNEDVEGGVILQFKQSFQKHQHLRVEENTNFGNAIDWKEALINYIENGCIGNFNLSNLTLTAEEVRVASNMLEAANENREAKFIYLVNLHTIRVIP
jgi:hypothetical protein